MNYFEKADLKNLTISIGEEQAEKYLQAANNLHLKSVVQPHQMSWFEIKQTNFYRNINKDK